MGVLNYLVRFGWSYGDQEIFRRDELIALFSWDRVGRSDGKFDEKKFSDVAFEHLKRPELTSVERYAELVRPFLAARAVDVDDEQRLTSAIPLIRERARTLIEAAAALDYFFREPPEVDEQARTKFLRPDAAPRLRALLDKLALVEPFEAAALETSVRGWLDADNISMKEVAQPARVAVTGRTASPPLFDVMAVLGRERCCARLERAIALATRAGSPAG
jgi:glutamyl-tRNA synthetase